MISLEDTVNRCGEWLKKLQNYQEIYFVEDSYGHLYENPRAGKI